MIHKKEADRYESLYQDYVQNKFTANKVTLRDVKRSRARLQELNDRATSKQRMSQEFQQLSYFQYLTKNLDPSDRYRTNQKMLRGQFKVNIS
jgi:hypothetical protein